MARNDWGALASPKPRNDWAALSAPREVAAAAPPTLEIVQPPQRLSFFERFMDELPGAAYDVVSSPFRGAAAVGEVVGDIGRVALGPSGGSGSQPDDPRNASYQAAKARLRADVAPFVDPQAAVGFQANLAQHGLGQTALRAEQGMSDIAEAGLSLASRALGTGSMSATLHQQKADREAFLAAAEAGGDIESTLGKTGSRIFNNVIRSTTKMAASGLAGPTAIYSLVAGEAFDNKLAEREAKGGGGLTDVSDAINAATIETGLTFLMGRFAKRLGVDSLEEALSPGVRNAAAQLAARAVPQSVRARAGKALAGAGLEWSEENVIDLTQQAVELFNGDRQTIDWRQALEAGVTGGVSRLAVGGVKEIFDRLRRVPADVLRDSMEGATAAERALSDTGALPVRDSLAAAEAAGRQPGAPGRGARNAKRFVENATPEMLAAVRAGLSRGQFERATGIKGTGAVFRRAFVDTLALYDKAAKPPITQPASPTGPTSTPPAPGMTADPSTTGTPVQAPQGPGTGLADRARNWLRANFTSAGLRNDSIETANDDRMGRVAEGLMQSEQLRADLDRAINAAYGGRANLTPAQVRQLDDALKGKPAPAVPAEVMAAIEPMRAHVDSLSRAILAEGVVDPDSDLGMSIEANEGSYLTRTYRKHDDANWTRRVRQDAALMDRARQWLAIQHPTEPADAIEWRLNVMLDKDSAGAAPASVPKSERDFQSVLKQRKDLPDVVRELFGEYRDPWINYTKSVAKMVNLVAHKQFMATVRDAGMATGFLSDETSPRPANYRKIDPVKTPRLAELAGLYTDPLTAKAMQDLFSPEFQSTIFRAMVKAAGYAKWAQTVGNSKTHVRNFVGNIQFALSNGDLFSGNWQAAAKLTLDNLLAKGSDDARAYLRNLARLGLVDSNVDVGDIQSMAAEMTDVDSVPREGVWRHLDKFTRGAAGLSRVYQAQDSFWKIMGFENKKAQYARAFPDRSTAEIERLAADDIKAHYPTYKKLPKAIKWISRVPLIGPFISFPSEVVRTLKNSLVTVARDLRSDNPQLQEMAKQRAVGMVSSFALVPALAAMSRAWQGISAEEEEDLRQFLPSWSENSQLFHLGKDGAGNYDTVDLSFLDSRSIIAKPLMGLLRGGDVEDRVTRAAQELVTPLGEDLLFGRLLSVWRNRTPDGRQVFNEQAELAEKAKQIGAYLGQVVTPGTIQQLDRIRRGVAKEVSQGGKPYDAMLETAALFGLRISGADTAQSFGYRNADMERAMNEAERGILSVAMRRGTVTPGQIDTAYQSYNRQRKRLIQQWHELAMAAIRLGVPEGEVRRAVVTATGATDGVAVLGGVFRPYFPSDNALTTIATRPDGPARVQQLLTLFREAQEKEAADAPYDPR